MSAWFDMYVYIESTKEFTDRSKVIIGHHHCLLVILIQPFYALVLRVACQVQSSLLLELLFIIEYGSSLLFDVHSGVSFLPPL